MANLDEVQKLTVPKLRELAGEYNVEVADSDKKDDLVLKLADGVTDEQLAKYVEIQGGSNGSEEDDSQDEEHANGGDNAAGSAPAGEQPTPPVAAGGNAEETHEANSATVPGVSSTENKDNENEEAAARTQARLDGAKAVDTELGTSEEESAAERANVGEENLNNPKQNREPKNQFEQENQPVTEQERQAAQKASDVKAETHNEDAPTPGELGAQDAQQSAATNQGNQIADAIAAGFKRATNGKDDFELQPEEGIDPRFSLVRNKQTGDVMLRDNSDGTLSSIQLKSLEEKESDLQDTEVEEL